MPKIGHTLYQQLGEAKTDSPLETSEEDGPADTLIWLLAPELWDNKYVDGGHPVLVRC